METTFNLSFEDIKTAQLILYRRYPGYKFSKFSVSFILSFFLFFALHSNNNTLLSLSISVFFLVLSYFFLCDLSAKVEIFCSLLMKKKETEYPRKVTLFLEEDFFIYEYTSEHYKVPWSSVNSVVEKDNIYIFLVSTTRKPFIIKKESHNLNVLENNNKIKEMVELHSETKTKDK